MIQLKTYFNKTFFDQVNKDFIPTIKTKPHIPLSLTNSKL